MPDWNLTAQGFRIFPIHFLQKLQKNPFEERLHRRSDPAPECARNGESFTPGPASESAELLIFENIHIENVVFPKNAG